MGPIAIQYRLCHELGSFRTDHIQPVLHFDDVALAAADLAGALSDVLDKAGDQVALQLDRQVWCHNY